MWWSRALVVIALASLGPVGCGFQPLYARPDQAVEVAAADEMATVRVAGIRDRLGQQLRNALVARLSPGGEPGDYRYTLTVDLTETLEGIGLQKDGNASMGRMRLNATYILVDREGKGLRSGTSRSIVSFNFLGPRYASVAAERDAEERALTEVAEDIRHQVGLYFAGRLKSNASQAPTGVLK